MTKESLTKYFQKFVDRSSDRSEIIKAIEKLSKQSGEEIGVWQVVEAMHSAGLSHYADRAFELFAENSADLNSHHLQ